MHEAYCLRHSKYSLCCSGRGYPAPPSPHPGIWPRQGVPHLTPLPDVNRQTPVKTVPFLVLRTWAVMNYKCCRGNLGFEKLSAHVGYHRNSIGNIISISLQFKTLNQNHDCTIRLVALFSLSSHFVTSVLIAPDQVKPHNHCNSSVL